MEVTLFDEQSVNDLGDDEADDTSVVIGYVHNPTDCEHETAQQHQEVRIHLDVLQVDRFRGGIPS